ncbi:hypothetical protein AB0N05_09190 [Nocardia sp. NPDC051030]|uniref:beta family protein n=1 Tax=Nocardia sp. NPDC051030 TaxID=3155162 RepID=UPI003442DAEE
MPCVRRRFEESLDRLRRHWRPRFDLMVDAHGLPGTESWDPTAYLVDDCADAQMAVIPAIRLSDPEQVLNEVGAAVRRACHQPICLRLTEADLSGDDASSLPWRVERAVHALGKSPDSIHLVVDLGTVADEDDALLEARIARRALLHLPHIDGWKSITVAGGGFPQDLRRIPPKVITRIERSEVTLWRTVLRRLDEKFSRTLSFGDYAIAFPRQASGGGFSPPPQLRYTADNAWLVMKYGKNERHARFFDICGVIADQPEFTPGLTWGDEEIEARGRREDLHPFPTEPGPGNASTWRAIGTSHHIGFVATRLTAPGEP